MHPLFPLFEKWRRSLLKSALGVAVLLSSSNAVVGSLQIWMAPGKPQMLLPFQDEIWVASTKGIYAFEPSKLQLQKRYHSGDGVVGGAVSLLAQVEGELHAVAHAGEVLRYLPQQKRWEMVNHSWRGQGVVTPGVAASQGRYLLFASGKRFAFYDRRTDRTELTIERLQGGDVQQLIATKEGLWVLLDSAFWQTPVAWDSLDATRDSRGKWVNLSDPTAWNKVELSTAPPYRHASQLENGGWIATNARPAPSFRYNGAVFSLNGEELCRKEGSKRGCVPMSGDDVEGIRLLAIDSSEQVWGWGEPQFWHYDGNWNRAFEYSSGLAATTAAVLERWVRPLAVDRDGRWFTGSWGKGVMQRSAEGKEEWLVPESNLGCPEQLDVTGVAEQPSFAVIPSVVPHQNGVLFNWWKKGGDSYGIGWWNGKKATCRSVSGVQEPYTLVADPSEEGCYWQLHSLGVQKLEIAPRLASLSLRKEYPSGVLGTMSGLAVDHLGRKWVSGTGGIGIICDQNSPDGICQMGAADTLVRADLWLGMPEALYTVVRHDGHGNLWFGTWGEGAIQLHLGEGNEVKREWKQWGHREGLPSSEIIDLQINSRTGEIWMVTSSGIVRLESSGRDRTQFGVEQPPGVYPNPFYPQKVPTVRFDRLPPAAVVALYSRSGRLIRRWSGEALAGGLVEWDGRDRAGNAVQPGTYNWVVSAPSGSWKGRLLLIR